MLDMTSPNFAPQRSQPYPLKVSNSPQLATGRLRGYIATRRASEVALAKRCKLDWKSSATITARKIKTDIHGVQRRIGTTALRPIAQATYAKLSKRFEWTQHLQVEKLTEDVFASKTPNMSLEAR